jgi:transcriptional regulator with XRE-family HTH domain
MEMRVDAARIRAERTQRAWSQEHLANATDLGLRTIQRIEAAGSASNESVSAIASAFGVPVSSLIMREPGTAAGAWLGAVAARRLWVLVALILVVQLLSPPVLSVALVGLWAWAGLEAVLLLARRRAPNSSG